MPLVNPTKTANISMNTKHTVSVVMSCNLDTYLINIKVN